jgi:hypothetical protein
MKNVFFLLILCVAAISACGAAEINLHTIAGDWTGESICTVHPSSCHDEHVIYHVTEPDSGGKLQITMDKVVDGKPEFMVTLDCTYDKGHSAVACPMRGGMWDFVVSGTAMNGTLKLPDGTLFRRISVHKEV